MEVGQHSDLENIGYAAVDPPSFPTERWDRNCFSDSGVTRTGRRIYTLQHVTKREIASLAKPVASHLHRIMSRPAFQVAQVVEPPPEAEIQDVHRDHDLEAGKMLTLVFDRHSAPVDTLFDAGSHKEQHSIVYRNRDRALVNESRLARMKVCRNEGAVMFDPFIMHAGAALNRGEEERFCRMFVSFVDLDIPREELEQLNVANYRKASFRGFIPI